jgi:ribonuclease BN (tRNA processing enzyme)
MKVIVVGSSHGVPEKNRACTSLFLCAGGNTYIFDAGADISYHLRHNDIPHSSVKGIFITHPHTDHIDGLNAFCDQLLWFYGFDECVPKFFFPQENCIRALNMWMEIMQPHGPYRRDGFDFNVYNEGVIFNDGIVKVTAIRTKHCENSFSFRVECEGKLVFFTGDLGYSFPEYLDVLGDYTYDVVFCEGAHHNPGTVNEMLKTTPTKKLVIHHLNPDREVELVKLPGTTTFECLIAYDGLIVEI